MINTSSGNGLVANMHQAIHEPMLTKVSHEACLYRAAMS